MGEYDFLSGLDLGDLGSGIAGGANMPNLPDVSGMSFDIPNFTVPNFANGIYPSFNGVMGGITLPSTPNNFPSMESGLMPQAPALPNFTASNLPPGAGVTLNPRGISAPPDQPGGFNVADAIRPAQGVLQGLTGLAGLGLSGMGIKASLDAAKNAREQAGMQRGFQQNQQQLQQTQQKSIQPLQQFGTNQLQQASAGQVDPAIQAYIDEWAQAEKTKMQQFFARNGITNSTMMQSALGQIDRQALAMRSSVIGQDKNTAIQALQAAMSGTGTAMQGAASGAQVANQEQNQLDGLIRSSQQALAQLNAMAQ